MGIRSVKFRVRTLQHQYRELPTLQSANAKSAGSPPVSLMSSFRATEFVKYYSYKKTEREQKILLTFEHTLHICTNIFDGPGSYQKYIISF